MSGRLISKKQYDKEWLALVKTKDKKAIAEFLRETRIVPKPVI